MNDYTELKAAIQLHIDGLQSRIDNGIEKIRKNPDMAAKRRMDTKVSEVVQELARLELCKDILSGTDWAFVVELAGKWVK